MINATFSNWPSFTQEETDAVRRVLLSNGVNYWTGTECRDFEKEFAEFADSQYAIAVSNGTTALDLAFIALGIGLGDEVIVTSKLRNRIHIAWQTSKMHADNCFSFFT